MRTFGPAPRWRDVPAIVARVAWLEFRAWRRRRSIKTLVNAMMADAYMRRRKKKGPES